MHRIILSGVKHSGKSTVGWSLSSQLGLYFADLDDLIIRDAEIYPTVRDLYRQLGKEGFQKQESESLKHFLEVNKGKPFVLALGGGTIENSQAVTLLREASVHTVFLDAAEVDLFQRIAKGGLPPFLEGDNPEEKFRIMYEKRSRLYREWADAVIDTRKKTPAQICAEIAEDLDQT